MSAERRLGEYLLEAERVRNVGRAALPEPCGLNRCVRALEKVCEGNAENRLAWELKCINE